MAHHKQGQHSAVSAASTSSSNNSTGASSNGGNNSQAYKAHIPVPPKLDVASRSLENIWRRYKRQWETYEIASRLNVESEAYRGAVFLSVIGDDAYDVYEGFKFGENDPNNITSILQKFEEYCIGEANEIYDTYIFNSRNQLEHEAIDTYITSLRSLAKTCNFKDEERMIRDRIVMGIKEEKIRQKLLAEKKLTLQTCIDICRAQESSTFRASNITIAKVNTVQRHQPVKYHNSKCCRCGRDHGPHCPAKSAKCKNCGKVGHYAVVCRNAGTKFKKNPKTQGKSSSHKVQLVEGEDEQSGCVFLGAITQINNQSDPWCVEVIMEGQPIKFKLDTGADVTVLGKKHVPRSKYPLLRADKKLYGPGKNPLTVMGKFAAALQMDQKQVRSIQDVYVVESLEEPLLGRPAIEALNLISRLDSVSVRNYRQMHPKLFEGLGKLKETYKIKVAADAKPFAVSAPRRVPLPLQKKVEMELQRLQNLDVIRPVKNPTDWCAPIVVVPKPRNDTVRLCVDLTKLNESVKRENYPLPSTDQLLAQLEGAKFFTKLDCNSGFYQVPLHPSSQELTTFVTPFGRFCFKRLPFGISSGPEIFHRIMTQMLAGIPGVICDIDDVLISGRNEAEHDQRLHRVLAAMESAGVTLNDKCEFKLTSIKFLGHVLSAKGIHMDPAKIDAIKNFPKPVNIPELRRLMGMVNFVRKFSPDLSTDIKPLSDLLKKDTQWIWGSVQERAFSVLKVKLCSPPILAHYSPELPTKVSADASSYGLGAVLLQEKDGNWRPVCYASRTMTATEQRYAQIEKEALASTWACEKFEDYLVGLPTFTIETDHRPLLALLKTKAIDDLSPRIQRFRMRLMRYSYHVVYTPGKDLHTADALSRAPVGKPELSDVQLAETTDSFVNAVIDALPVTQERLREIKEAQASDPSCSMVSKFCKEGWPRKPKADIQPYFQVRDDLSVQNDLLMFGTRIVIPASLREDILQRVHAGHQGIVKCRALAKTSIWWPGMSKMIRSLVEKCPICEKERRHRPEPLKPSTVPDYPWQKLGMDLFEWKGHNYLLVIDYFSRYIEIAYLRSSTSSETVIEHLKSIFARHGIPEKVRSDNGPQFASLAFARFSKNYGFDHETSSPHFPQSNGEAERAVQTIKNMLQKAADPYIAMLNYRATPLQSGFSPAEMLMGRRLRTRVPVVPANLIPEWPKLGEMIAADEMHKQNMKRNFDEKHRTKDRPEMRQGDKVWIKHPTERSGTVKRRVSSRSYEIETSTGVQRRNRRHLRKRSDQYPPRVHPSEDGSNFHPVEGYNNQFDSFSDDDTYNTEGPGLNQGHNQSKYTTTRSGRIVKPPDRLDL